MSQEAREDDLYPSDMKPWDLQLHFTDWPDEHLVRLDPDGRVMHDAFINSVKEVRLSLEKKKKHSHQPIIPRSAHRHSL